MKKQTAGRPVRGNNTAVAVAEQVNEPFYMYGTITKGKGNKKTNHRAVVAGIQVAPGAVRIGLSVCSTKDKFIKAKGKVIALGRAKSSVPQDVLYITDDAPVSKQFVARAISLVTPAPKKNTKSETELAKLN